MAEHGDKRRALELTVALLERHPDFAPALKLQGTLLEDTGARLRPFRVIRRHLS